MVCAVYLVVVSFPGGAGGNDKKTRTSLPVLGVRHLSHAPQGEQAKEGGGASPGTKAPGKRALQRGNGRRLSRSFSRMRDARYLGCIEYLPVSGLSILGIGLAGRTAEDLLCTSTAMSQAHAAAPVRKILESKPCVS